jgi:hypothetical protein
MQALSVWNRRNGACENCLFIRISYDIVGFIPLNELMKEETA